MFPAIGELTVRQKVICQSGMGIDMIGVDLQCALILLHRFVIVAPMADRIADIAQQIRVVRGIVEGALIKGKGFVRPKGSGQDICKIRRKFMVVR